jgi:predicted MFS family arabinose efflux permease
MFQNRSVLYYTIIVSLGGFIFGFDASVISGAIGFVATEFSLSTWQQGFVVSSPTLGGIIATITAGAICDAIGRRKTLILIAFLYLVSALASALATDFWMLVTARFIAVWRFVL